jgi:malonyl-CoA decarboxylase
MLKGSVMSDVATPPGLIDRALRRVTSLWRDIASSAPAGEEGFAAQMRACLDAKGGEVSARSRAARLAQSYLAADEAARAEFLRALASFDSDAAAVTAALEAVTRAPDAEARATAKAKLRRVLEPPRLRLMTQFTTNPDGVKLPGGACAPSCMARLRGDKRLLQALDVEICAYMFWRAGSTSASWTCAASTWSTRRPRCWKSSSSYEAVHRHPQPGADLKNRLDSATAAATPSSTRACPKEPLIFVEVALVERAWRPACTPLLDEKAAAPARSWARPTTAVFYSISNCADAGWRA